MWAKMKTIAAKVFATKHRFAPDFSVDMFAAVEGVCDTPLHIYDWFDDNTMIESVDLWLYFHPMKPWFQPNRCRGVSHTPSRGRKWNDGNEHNTIVEWACSPLWRAYAICPYTFTLNIMNKWPESLIWHGFCIYHTWWKVLLLTAQKVFHH